MGKYNVSVDEVAYTLFFGAMFICAPATVAICAHILGWI
jgi:hypothetical protein